MASSSEWAALATRLRCSQGCLQARAATMQCRALLAMRNGKRIIIKHASKSDVFSKYVGGIAMLRQWVQRQDDRSLRQKRRA